MMDHPVRSMTRVGAQIFLRKRHMNSKNGSVSLFNNGSLVGKKI